MNKNSITNIAKLALLSFGFSLSMASQAETISVMPVQTAVPVEKKFINIRFIVDACR